MKFQSELGNVSEEIKKLQDECLQHQVKLRNRQEVGDRLHKFVEDVAVSPGMNKLDTVKSLY